METYLAYFDETGDDGLLKYSCDHFVLTSMYMSADKWQENFNTTARKIRAFNPIPSMFGQDYMNKPIQNMVEDILEKDSKESYFIQAADFISYFAHLYFITHDQKRDLPNRVANIIDPSFVASVFATLKKGEKINLNASRTSHPYGFVIYPK